MIEMTLMDPSKETDNKLRWQMEVDGVSFKLYIPKWRVPKPWPARILVHLREAVTPKEPGRQRAAGTNPDTPIIATVERVAEHSQTLRFRPCGDQKAWEIGEPYIPLNLLPDPEISALNVEVEWDQSAGSWTGTNE